MRQTKACRNTLIMELVPYDTIWRLLRSMTGFDFSICFFGSVGAECFPSMVTDGLVW